MFLVKLTNRIMCESQNNISPIATTTTTKKNIHKLMQLCTVFCCLCFLGFSTFFVLVFVFQIIFSFSYGFTNDLLPYDPLHKTVFSSFFSMLLLVCSYAVVAIKHNV